MTERIKRNGPYFDKGSDKNSNRYDLTNTPGWNNTKPEIKKTDDSMDSCGRYKYYRVQVHSEPVCLTVPEIGEDDVFEIYQLFGPPSCFERKKTDYVLDIDCCQIILLKPGHYELRTPDFTLFPENWSVHTRKLSRAEADTLVLNKGAALCM
jgi:hypothetical protein